MLTVLCGRDRRLFTDFTLTCDLCLLTWLKNHHNAQVSESPTDLCVVSEEVCNAADVRTTHEQFLSEPLIFKVKHFRIWLQESWPANFPSYLILNVLNFQLCSVLFQRCIFLQIDKKLCTCCWRTLCLLALWPCLGLIFQIIPPSGSCWFPFILQQNVNISNTLYCPH